MSLVRTRLKENKLEHSLPDKGKNTPRFRKYKKHHRGLQDFPTKKTKQNSATFKT